MTINKLICLLQAGHGNGHRSSENRKTAKRLLPLTTTVIMRKQKIINNPRKRFRGFLYIHKIGILTGQRC